MNRDWTGRAVCRTRPYDWWETGDGGNRLAMTLCKLACPVLSDCGLYARNEAGVVRAGIAYSDSGRVLPVCCCGRPVVDQPSEPGWCRTCRPLEPKPWRAKPVTRGGPVVDAVADLTGVPVTEQEEPMCPACEVVRRSKTPCPVAGCGYGGAA